MGGNEFEEHERQAGCQACQSPSATGRAGRGPRGLNSLAALASPNAAPLPFSGVTQARISQGFSPSRLFPSHQGKRSIANVADPSHLHTRFTVNY